MARLVDRLDLVLENLALQHQLRVYERGRRLQGSDRLYWCLLSRFWLRWREPLMVVQPATVWRWRRTAWWRHLGQRLHLGGRPPIDPDLQALIQRMAAENRLWGSMRIVGALRAAGLQGEQLDGAPVPRRQRATTADAGLGDRRLILPGRQASAGGYEGS